jgi:DnaJ-class molecular chaperone
MPNLGRPDDRGDLYADVTVILPTQLDAEQHRLFETFARSTGYTGRATAAGVDGSNE